MAKPSLERGSSGKHAGAIWWDERPARTWQRGRTMDEGRVPQTGYVYQDQDWRARRVSSAKVSGEVDLRAALFWREPSPCHDATRHANAAARSWR